MDVGVIVCKTVEWRVNWKILVLQRMRESSNNDITKKTFHKPKK